MAISQSLRNRIVGFTIVASTILIFLPVILSKDMIKRENPDAIAVNGQGAVVNQNGDLTLQPTANHELALNLGGKEGSLNLAPNASSNSAVNANIPGATDDNVEMLEFSRPEMNNSNNQAPIQIASSPKEEVLVANPAPAAKPKPQPQATAPKEEVLVAATPKPQAKPQNPVQSTQASSSSSGEKLVYGSKPNARYVIQVGVFSKRSNADSVIEKIKGEKINVYAIQYSSNGRDLFRVYAGGANNRNDLNDSLVKLDKLCGTKGKIVPI